jgi:ABC-type polysaccharide/polyol phosphate export permease
MAATVTAAPPAPTTVSRPLPATARFGAFATLVRRRFALSARTPREILVPLVTPILFACVIAPALARTMGHPGGLDYLSFVAVGTVGLLVPLSAVLGGIGLLVDRDSGAQRDLLAAPIPRATMVLANLAVAVVIASLQVVALLVAAVVRGADFQVGAAGALWFAGATLGVALAMHGAAETLASRIPTQEEYVGAAPPIALVPWFFAGSFFPISAMPAGLTVFAKVLPLTHALALMRYGLVDPSGAGLHDIWGRGNTTLMAGASLAVVAAFAAGLLLVAVRSFSRAAVR